MKNGDFVKIEYVGRTESGEIFDLTDEELAKKEGIYNPKVTYKPVPIIIGEGFVIKGLDKALVDMKVGQEEEVEVDFKEGFGERSPNMVKTIPEKEFKKDNITPKPGMVIGGQGIKGRIQSVSGGRVRVDFNHPLAGKNLEYKVKITEEIKDDSEKIASLFQFFTNIHPEVEINDGDAEISVPGGQEFPQSLQQKISDLVLKYIDDVENVKFSSSFSKKEEAAENKKQ